MSGAYIPEALEANQAGRLTDDQRRAARGMSRGLRSGEVQLAGALAVIGLLVWFAPGPASDAVAKPLVGIAAIIIAAAILVRGLAGADPITNDLRSGKVVSVEGAISKRVVETSSRGSSSASYYLDVEHQRIHASRSAYDAAPEAGWVRVYYLPRSHHLVNFEHLPDHAVAPGAMGSPAEILKSMRAAVLSHDEATRAEARAQMAAAGNAMRPVEADPTPPSGAMRDPETLRRSLVGEWTSGMLDVVFAADGSVTLKLPAGVERSGQWSVDGSGHLVSDVTGTSEPGDVWMTGDVLTISVQGQALSFTRKA